MDNTQNQNFINTFVVTTANDENDGVNNGTGLSLREAIEAANNSAGADRIIFDHSLSGSNITLSLGEIAIADDLAIEGLGEEALTIDGADSSRIFNIDDGNTENEINVSIANLTIANGNSADVGGAITNAENLVVQNSTISGSVAENRGGGIYNSGNLLLKDSTVSDNQANQLSGGGIFNSGELTLQNSIISDNEAEGNGGGISNFQGSLTIENSTIDHNSSAQSGAGVGSIGDAVISNTLISNNNALGNGGGILNLDGNLELNNSQVIDNSAESGGGIENASEFGETDLSITNSTISGNVANFAGGGVYNALETDVVTINNSTLSNNQASYGGGISNSGTATISSSTISGNAAVISGGGIDNYVGVVNLSNSTISNNSAEVGAGLGNVYGVAFNVTSSIIAGNVDDNDLGGDAFTSGGNNLIGNGDGAAGFVPGENADLVGSTDNPIDPRLGALQDNGGATATQALLADSPAIDAGSNPDNLTFDQRGNSFIRANGAVDIGAFENQSLDIQGTKKKDTLVGASGDDTIFGFDDKDFLNGEEGNDQLFGGKGKDTIFGGLGDDLALGGKDKDVLKGNAGNDILVGEEGNDTLSGGDDHDLLKGGRGKDILSGDAGDDELYGEESNDILFGNSGNDLLKGGKGKDILIGGQDNDTLFGGEDSDLLFGGEGSDIFVLESLKEKDFIVDFDDGTDFFALGNGLSFEDLDIIDSKQGVMIQDASSKNGTIAIVKGINAVDITEEDFTAL